MVSRHRKIQEFVCESFVKLSYYYKPITWLKWKISMSFPKTQQLIFQFDSRTVFFLGNVLLCPLKAHLVYE